VILLTNPNDFNPAAWVDQSETVEVRIMQFSPYGSSLIHLVFAGFHPKLLG